MLVRDDNGRVDDARVVDHLELLGARAPSKVEEQSLKALARGSASAGQQKIAIKYVLEVGGAGRIMFEPTSDRLSAFRAGSQTLAQLIANIAGASWLSFRETTDGAEVDQEGQDRGR